MSIKIFKKSKTPFSDQCLCPVDYVAPKTKSPNQGFEFLAIGTFSLVGSDGERFKSWEPFHHVV